MRVSAEKSSITGRILNATLISEKASDEIFLTSLVNAFLHDQFIELSVYDSQTDRETVWQSTIKNQSDEEL